MKTITLTCDYCGKTFERRLSYHKYMTEKRGLDKVYCSPRCGFDAKIIQIDINDLKHRYESGQSTFDIARELGVSASFVAQRLKSANYKLRTKFAHMTTDKNPMKGNTHTAKAVAKIREARKRQFGTPENESRQMSEWAIARIIEGRTGKAYNKLEIALASLIGKAGLSYTQQYRLGRFVFDFYLPEFNVLVEAHGTYWHADPRFYNRNSLYPTQQKNIKNDKRKRQKAIDNGFRFLSFWEYDIYNSPELVITELQAI